MTGNSSASEPRVKTDNRPWGSFDQLVLNATISVKVITVEPGQRLSLQRHLDRDEWWQMLDPGLIVEVDGRAWEPAVNERVWIPRTSTHRVTNKSTLVTRFLEIAFGHFDENDIERLEDDYQRLP